MKKLIIIFVLLPFLASSQVLLEKVKTSCFSSKSRNIYDCTEDLSDKKIYIKNNVLYIKSNYGIDKHDVVAYCYSKVNSKEVITGYVIEITGLEYDLLIYYDNNHKKTITLASKKTDDFIMYRE